MAIQTVRINIGVGFTLAQQSQQASLERTLLEKKYWDELLERLRKMGGGGGGNDSRFDRVAVSMMLANFLSNKQVHAMLNNFTNVFLNLIENTGKIFQQNISTFVSNVYKAGEIIFKGLTNVISLIVRRDAPPGRLYDVSQYLNVLAGILSFQLNKLKEILEEDLKELIRKLDMKGKIKKVKEMVLDFFVEMKEGMQRAIESILGKIPSSLH